MADEKQTVQCECGYCGPVSKFCPECGRKMEIEKKEYVCDCGAVVTGRFCTNCGKPGPEHEAFVPNNELSPEEKKNLAEHGWRDQSGSVRMILRDGRFASSYSIGTNPGFFTGAGFTPQKPEELTLDTSYSFSEIGSPFGIGIMMGGMGSAIQSGVHTNESFCVYLRERDYRKAEPVAPAGCRITKLWYGSGTLHADLYIFEGNKYFTVDLLQDDNVEISFLKPKVPVGLTCPKCGSEFQTGAVCKKCGEQLNWMLLFSGSTYSTTNPPTSEGFRVFEFSDEKLIFEYYSNEALDRRYISAQVLDEAYKIIKEHHIDEWERYKDHMTGIMGGCVYVSYRDGDKLVGSSMDQMGSLVSGAYYALNRLFHQNVLE